MAKKHNYPAIVKGQRFGKLTVIEQLKDKPRYYKCKCDCGRFINARKDHLLAGNTTKCRWCPKIDYSGQTINGLKIIKPLYHDKSFNWYYQIECTCGKIFKSTIGSIKSGHTKSCGHLAASQNGLSKDPRYSHWQAMLDRTTNPKHKAFKHYDQLIQGTKIYPEWIQSPKAFFDEIGPMPDPTYTIDRSDNRKGYLPGNVRWASHTTQQRNREQMPGISGHPFIYYDKRRDAWIPYGGRRQKYLGQQPDLKTAIKVQAKYNKQIGFKL